ncbi:MAG: selenide, water dikinase SelD, partial [Candidatus Eremiobacteraeota bacterium]|nr:selenide, water dikinase SelD [Candidatus Eremiobacteraeota bacterium]
SDIYAMGARPLFAVAVAAFPEELDPAIVAAVLRGGVEGAAEAGIAIVGGHTIKDAEPKYGLAVTGIVHPKRVVRNDTGRAGDTLLLTKPIGTGILATARRDDLIEESELAPAIESMLALNAAASEVAVRFAAHAMTDVSGFGLLGHLREMIGRRLGARIDAGRVALFPKALQLAALDIVPGGTRANFDQAREDGARFDPALPPGLALLLCDAQTSGGLLIAVAPESAGDVLDALAAAGADYGHAIGSLTDELGIDIEWKPPHA